MTAPWVGPLGMAFALPVECHIHFGEPLCFDGRADDEEAAIESRVSDVKHAIAALLEQGLATRRGSFS